MTNPGEKQYQKAADRLALLCLASTVILILFLMFGPKKGPEALGLIIPWIFAGAVNLTLGPLALLYAFKTRAHFSNTWIYTYFLLFFGFNGYYLAITNEMDTDIARKIDDSRQPQESELWQLLQQREGGKYVEPARRKARTLVQQGADLSYIRPGTQELLIVMAAKKGDPELVRMMLERGADVSGPVSNTSTPLMQAVRNGHTAVVKVLLEYGAQPNDARYPYTPLMVATKNSDVPTARLLLAAGAEPDTQTSSSSPALGIAVSKGDSRMIKLLLDHGADPDIMTNGWHSPVLGAVQAGCVECVRHLVGAGGTALGHTSNGETVLVIAIKQGQKEIIDILSTSGTPLGSAKDLFYAINHQDLQMLETLLALGVSPDARNDQGDTVLLHLAMRSQYRRQMPEADVAAARVMIAHGADINATGKYAQTPLNRAAGTGAVEMALLLIDKGADVDAATDNGHTPLKASLIAGHREIASALIEAGADTNIVVNGLGAEWHLLK